MGFAIHVMCFLLAVGSTYGVQLPITIPGTTAKPAENPSSTYMMNFTKNNVENMEPSVDSVATQMPDSGNCVHIANMNGTMRFGPGSNKPQYSSLPISALSLLPGSTFNFKEAQVNIQNTKMGDQEYVASLIIKSVSEKDNCTLINVISFTQVEYDNKNLKPMVDLADNQLKESGSKATNVDCGILKEALTDSNCNEFCTIPDTGNSCKKIFSCYNSNLVISKNQLDVIKSMKGDDGKPQNHVEPVESSEGKDVKCYKSTKARSFTS